MSTCPSYDPAQPDARAIGLGGVDADRRRLNLVVVGGAGQMTQRACGPCQETGCVNWQRSRCRVGDRLVEAGRTAISPEARWQVEECEIRPDCRWFAQSGAAACDVCAYVIEARFYGEAKAAAAPVG